MVDLTSIESTTAFLQPVVLKLLTPLIIVLLGFIVGKISGKLILKALKQINLDQNFKNITGLKFKLSSFCSGFVTYFIYFVALVLALKELGIDTFIFNIIALAIIIVILISLILAIKDFVPNVMAGILIKQKKFFKKGDKIHIFNVEGIVQEIGLFETKIKSKKKDIILVPNNLFMKNKIEKKN